MAERKYTHGLELTCENDAIVMHIGDMEIWDGADLSLVRDTLMRLISEDGCAVVGIDMQYVQYVPSGFFGMLFDWYERGIEVRLYQPRERVEKMLWFRKFFKPHSENIYNLHDGLGVNEEEGEELWAPEFTPSETTAELRILMHVAG